MLIIFVLSHYTCEFSLSVQVTQEITDESRVFRVLGTNRYVNSMLTRAINHCEKLVILVHQK